MEVRTSNKDTRRAVSFAGQRRDGQNQTRDCRSHANNNRFDHLRQRLMRWLRLLRR